MTYTNRSFICIVAFMMLSVLILFALTWPACGADVGDFEFSEGFEEDDDPGFYDVCIGDINVDGSVNAKDSNMLQKFIAGSLSVKKGSVEFYAADLNSDGELNAKDSNSLKKLIAGEMKV